MAFHGTWRPAGEPEIMQALDADEAMEQFAKLMSGVEHANVHSFLAYH